MTEEALYFVYHQESTDDSANWLYLNKKLTYKFEILSDSLLISPNEIANVDVFKTHPSGFSQSHRFKFVFDLEKKVLSIEESEENKIVVKETDPDKLIQSTFKLGFSNQSSKSQKDQLLLPHFEMIKATQSKPVDIEEQLEDEEQDEEDDVDV